RNLKPSRACRVVLVVTSCQPCPPGGDRTRSGLGPMGGSSGGWKVAASTVTMNRRARFRQQKERVIPPALAGRRTARAPRVAGSAPAGRKGVKKAVSALEIGGDLLVQLVGGEGAAEHLAVDEKGGGGVDVEFLRRARLRLLEGVEHLLIREAFVERLLGEAGLFGDGKHGLERLLHHPI